MPDNPWVRRLPGHAAVLPAQMAAATLVALLVSMGPLPLIGAARLSWVASVIFSGCTLVAAQHIARQLPVGHPARRFWWAICFNAVTSGTAYLTQLALTAGGGSVLIEQVPTMIVGLGTAVVVVVMCTYPLGVRSGRERICYWLDMATVMVGASAFGWYFSVSPDGTTHSLATVLTGPAIMLVAVFAVAKLLIAGRPPFRPLTGVLGGASAVVGGITGVLGASMLAAGGGPWLLALSASGDAFMMIGIWLQRVRLDGDALALDRTRRRPYSVLPYVALIATFVLLATALRNRGLDGPTIGVLAGAALSTGLVVVRQMAAFTDNARLLAELDATVTELRHTEVGLRSAIAERDQFAARLHHLAYRDSLTGLANRALFHDRLATALKHSEQHGVPVGVMLLDLDDFKPINDRFGHAAGDAVLQAVADRIRMCVRVTDTVARLGGDEFAVLLDQPSLHDVTGLADRITTAVRAPCLVEGVDLAVGVSIGVATGLADGYDAARLLREADTTMYAAKNQARSASRVAVR